MIPLRVAFFGGNALYFAIKTLLVLFGWSFTERDVIVAGIATTILCVNCALGLPPMGGEK